MHFCGCGETLNNPRQVQCRACHLKRERERSKALYQPAPPRSLTCHECGSTAEVAGRGRRRRFCSPACAKRNAKRTGRLQEKLTHRLSIVERVDPVVVFERDGWTCKACSTETPRMKLGSPDTDAPTLDHIVPRSADGPHTYANTQCLCRACNMAKGNQLQAA